MQSVWPHGSRNWVGMGSEGHEVGITLGPQGQATTKPREGFYMSAPEEPRPLIQLHGNRKTRSTTCHCWFSSMGHVKTKAENRKARLPKRTPWHKFHQYPQSINSGKKIIYLFQLFLHRNGRFRATPPRPWIFRNVSGKLVSTTKGDSACAVRAGLWEKRWHFWQKQQAKDNRRASPSLRGRGIALITSHTHAIAGIQKPLPNSWEQFASAI